jgi:hypothetical protein
MLGARPEKASPRRLNITKKNMNMKYEHNEIVMNIHSAFHLDSNRSLLPLN